MCNRAIRVCLAVVGLVFSLALSPAVSVMAQQPAPAVRDADVAVLWAQLSGAPQRGAEWGRQLAMSEDGGLVAIAGARAVRVYAQAREAEAGGEWELRASWSSTSGAAPTGLALDPTGSVLAVGLEGSPGRVVVLGLEGMLVRELATLAAAGPAARDGFGHAIALSRRGERIAVGAPRRTREDGGRGVVAVFQRDADTWAVAQTLTPLEPRARRMGDTVALSADGALLVFSTSRPTGASGVVHVHRLEAGVFAHVQTLTDTDPRSDFGRSVAVSPDAQTIVVGAPGVHLGDVPGAGAVELFTRGAVDFVASGRVTLPQGDEGPQRRGLGTHVAVTREHVLASSLRGPSVVARLRDPAEVRVLEGSARVAAVALGGAGTIVLGLPAEPMGEPRSGDVRLFRLVPRVDAGRAAEARRIAYEHGAIERMQAESERDSDAELGRAGRTVVQLAAGLVLVGGAAVGAVPLVNSMRLYQPCTDTPGDVSLCGLSGLGHGLLVLGVGFGTPIAIALTSLLVQLVGDALGGDGAPGWTIVGELIGVALGAALIAGTFALASEGDRPDALALIAGGIGGAAVLTLAGAVLGYALSDGLGRARVSELEGLGPVVRVTHEQLVLGLAGAF